MILSHRHYIIIWAIYMKETALPHPQRWAPAFFEIILVWLCVQALTLRTSMIEQSLSYPGRLNLSLETVTIYIHEIKLLFWVSWLKLPDGSGFMYTCKLGCNVPETAQQTEERINHSWSMSLSNDHPGKVSKQPKLREMAALTLSESVLYFLAQINSS